MDKAEYDQICAFIDTMPGGQIPPVQYVDSMVGGMGTPNQEMKNLPTMWVAWPPRHVRLVSADALKAAMKLWVST